MSAAPRLLSAQVMHRRLLPTGHAFRYRVFYLVLPLGSVERTAREGVLPVNRAGLASFHYRDFGYRDGTHPLAWARDRLAEAGLYDVDGEVVLVTMPRLLGYLFNPVSFWFCHDRDGAVRAVLCEVNNTFGESHTYLCAHEDARPITSADWLEADKCFHVSPFFERDGRYRFRFEASDDRVAVQIDYLGEDGNTRLQTAVGGELEPLSRRTLRRAIWRHPLQTLMVTGRIHWHALRLWRKGIRYVPKPLQFGRRVTSTREADRPASSPRAIVSQPSPATGGEFTQCSTGVR